MYASRTYFFHCTYFPFTYENKRFILRIAQNLYCRQGNEKYCHIKSNEKWILFQLKINEHFKTIYYNFNILA
jgi:hypothetical protein